MWLYTRRSIIQSRKVSKSGPEASLHARAPGQEVRAVEALPKLFYGLGWRQSEAKSFPRTFKIRLPSNQHIRMTIKNKIE